MRFLIQESWGARALRASAALLLLIGQGCATRADDAPESTAESAEGLQGPTSFVSGEPLYDFYLGEEEEEEREAAGEEAAALEPAGPLFQQLGAPGAASPTLAQGDIYEVLGDGHVLALNVTRGLLVIDVKDPEKPRIVGRLQLGGEPLQMHVTGNRALVVMGESYHYSADPERIAAKHNAYAAVVDVDISDRSSPKLRSHTALPGLIMSSLFEKSASGDALYVGTSEWSSAPVGQRSRIQRFDVNHNALSLTSAAEVQGELRSLARRGGALVALHSVKGNKAQTTEVSIVDIGVGGILSVRGKVTALGAIRAEDQMDLRDGKLRVISGRMPYFKTPTAHLETWDASGPGNPTPIEHVDFAPGESVSGALFTKDRAYVSTYPYPSQGTLHTFSVDAAGHVAALGAASVAGRELHLRPVFGGSRLLCAGLDGPSGHGVTVRLWDTSAPSGAPSLLSQTSGDLSASDEAPISTNPRAFSILEGAVSVQAPGGQVETGLALVPYEGTNVYGNSSKLGLQLFTFSNTTLTRRGYLALDSKVLRGMNTSQSGAAALSDTELGVYDRADVDHPTKKGNLPLTRNFVKVFQFGDYRVRLWHPEKMSWLPNAVRKTTIEVTSRLGATQDAPTLASLQVPLSLDYYQVGSLLIAVRGVDDGPSIPLTIVDLSDPLHPKSLGEILVKGLALNKPVGSWYENPAIYPMESALAFVPVSEKTIPVGQFEGCEYYIRENESSCYGQEGCSYWTGRQYCLKPVGSGGNACDGGFAQCTYHQGADPTCVPVPLPQADPYVKSHCRIVDAFRDVQSANVSVLDLSNPVKPMLLPPVKPGASDEYVSTFSDRKRLYVTVKEPVQVSDPRPHAKYSVVRVILGSGGKLIVSRTNVPGEIVSVDGDTWITHDRVWGDHFLDSAVARLELKKGGAELKNYQRFADRAVKAVVVNDEGWPVVTYGLAFRPDWYVAEGIPWDPRFQVNILEPSKGAGVGGFQVLGQSLIEESMELEAAHGESLFFKVPGGKLVVDVSAKQMTLGRFFYWPNKYAPDNGPGPEPLMDGKNALYAAGKYGILQ